MKNWMLALLLGASIAVEGKLPELTPQQATATTHEMLAMHAAHKELCPELMRRTLTLYIEQLDPLKTYFIYPNIQHWIDPSDQLVEQAIIDYDHGRFTTFEQIFDALVNAVQFRQNINEMVTNTQLPKALDARQFQDLKWARSQDELEERLLQIRSLQIETASKFNEELQEKSMQRILKRQEKFEEEILNSSRDERQKRILSHVLKAIASSLDTHTAYFTPDEAAQFIINVQQRLYGIGAQLRDDLNGFTIVKIVEGGPAEASGELKLKDRIIAVNNEPVVGMDILDAVDLIRGKENTPVILTIIREDEEGKEENIDITIVRGEVILKETRLKSSYEPFGNGIIAYLHLYTFYQDEESSSAADIASELAKLKAEHEVKGVILDLRYNSGGLLSQAVQVTGLFITKGIVVSIKDDEDNIQHLRDLDSNTIWDGPLIVLVNRASASASEIVAQTLQDYGRALVVGDDHTFGKGSFQSFTLNSQTGTINPAGEFKVTRGRYYTVSGKTPQMTGVASDIVLKGPLSEFDIGEQYAKYPLDSDEIAPNFDDDLSDLPLSQRARIKTLYKFGLQTKLDLYNPYIEHLRRNAAHRIQNNKNYQAMLAELKEKDPDEEEEKQEFGQNDLQLIEAFNVMKDLIMMRQSDSKTRHAIGNVAA